MAGTPGDDSGNSSGQRCQSGEALAEWRSFEQLENGIPSTSPPYWDTDDDDDCGPKPAELYGKYTWKIDKFSQINKRELRSNAFEVGGYKWYILIYPQGCDVCNHLSLFLCVANHDKLLPGWSHFAQFTIAVVNKDPKKSKYSDTLHRFWKKEHDWGWKKFMELSKVLDGFIDADTLIIKAQVQVIRERADRPFRCLDCQYRRELVRVYLTNVEQICRSYVEERRGKLGKLIEDKARWSSFCAFWLGIDQNARRRMSRDKMDSILKVVVKHFFVEKEVTSTLVMDSLYSGLKALLTKKARGTFFDAEEQSIPIVRAEKDTFVLVDDVLLLLERAAIEPLPSKNEKGPQIRTKDGGLGEDFSKDSIERDERRLTELGRRTIELFFLSHIFSKIEVAYQEAVALRRQEELIREEEAAWLAISEQKSKKEKKSKKKQGKQKRNNKKGKDKGRDEKPGVAVEDEPQPDSRIDLVLERPGTVEDVSDVSDSIDCVPDILQPDSEDRDSSPVNWDTDTSEVHLPTEASGSGVGGLSAVQNEERKSPSVIDDSSSTCSTDSLPSVVMNGPYKGINSLPNHKSQKSPSKGRSQRGKGTSGMIGWAGNMHKHSSEALSDVGQASDVSGSCKVAESESEAVVNSLQDRIKWLEQHVVTKEEEVVSLQKKLTVKDEVNTERPPKQKTTEVLSSPRSPPKQKTTEMLSSPRSPPKSPPSTVKPKSDSKTTDPVFVRKPSRDIPQRTHKAATPISSAETTLAPKPYVRTAATPKPTEKPTAQQIPVPPEKPTLSVPPEKSTSQQLPVTTETPSTQQVPVVTEKAITQQAPVMSRHVTDPVNSGLKPVAPFVSMVQTTPLLSRSVSAAGRLGPDPSPAIHSNVPQSYRNAMMGSSSPVTATSAGFTQPPNSSPSYSQSPILVSAPIFLPQSSERTESSPIRPSVSYGMMNHEVLQSGPQWMECPQRGDDSSRSINSDSSSLFSDMRNFNLYKPASTSGRLAPGVMADEFPHLDIINDLLDDEQGVFLRAAQFNPGFQNYGNGPHHLNRQFSFPGDIGMMSDVGPSTSSCRRFERTRSYHDEELQHGYGSSGGSQFDFDLMRDINPQANNLQPYANGQIPNQWQVGGSDLSYLSSLRNTDGGDAYPYNIPDYSNLAYGVNGYTVYRPSNGH